MSQVINVTKANFKTEVLQSDLPVLVDFHATWCPPCKRLSPLLDRAASEFAGRIKFVKIDTGVEFELSDAFHVTSLPTLFLFENGKPVDKISGAPPQDQLWAQLNIWARPQQVELP